MNLAQMLPGINLPEKLKGFRPLGVTADSRDVRPGWLFLACPGEKADGRDYIEQAQNAGAGAILAESKGCDTLPEPAIAVSDLHRRWGGIAGHVYPKAPAHVFAVTGTDGKTTTAWLTAQLLADKGCLNIGTIGAGLWKSQVSSPGDLTPLRNTTPDILTTRRLLHEASDEASCAVVEASSAGLHQGRLSGLTLAGAAFTTLGHDHLQEHDGSQLVYFRAKQKLFTEYVPRTACISADYRALRALATRLRSRFPEVATQTFGWHPQSQARLHSKTFTPEGVRATLDYAGQRYQLDMTAALPFVLQNGVAALLLAESCGMPPQEAIERLCQAQLPPGRLQSVGISSKVVPEVWVDYAHTPQALATVCSGMKERMRALSSTPGRLWCVFGCGGERDAEKRPQMAQAASVADVLVITDDNPRGESPQAIRTAVRGGLTGWAGELIEIGDRSEAIHYAVQNADAADLLIVAGRGHEQMQQRATGARPFDDVKVAKQALMKRER